MLKKLPLALSDFRRLRESNCLYVDKTKYVYELITGYGRYFLSRPRRFGKSLLVSTLKQALEGNKGLFAGLWIADSDYTWEKHAVVFLDFSTLGGIGTPQEFLLCMVNALVLNGNQHGIELDTSSQSVSIIFQNYLIAMHKKYGKVAILIDEYDRPILHNLHNIELAKSIRRL